MTARHRSIGGSARLIGILTFISRILGLLRDIVTASVFALSPANDAFVFAFRIPNSFRRIFGEGALPAAFIPAFTHHAEEKGLASAWRFFNVVMSYLIVVLLSITVAGMAVCIMLPRVGLLDARWKLPMNLLAMMFPYTPLICVSLFLAAMLQCRMRFGIPALNPSLLNIFWMGAVLLLVPMIDGPLESKVYALAIGILAAGFAQLALQAWALRSEGAPFRFKLDSQSEELRSLLRIMGPLFGVMFVVQLNSNLDALVAVAMAGPADGVLFNIGDWAVHYPMRPGANAAIYYAMRLRELPVGVFGVAIATAAFPALSTQAAKADWNAFRKSLGEGMRLVIFLTIPATVGLLLLARPLVVLLFQRGAFGHTDSERCVRAVLASGLGVWAYCATPVLVRAYYSMKDISIVIKVFMLHFVMNLVLNLVLVWFMEEAGLALAGAISEIVRAGLFYVLLMKRLPAGDKIHLLPCLWKTLVATAAMAAVVLLLLRYLPQLGTGDVALAVKLLRLSIPTAAGGLVFGAVALLLRMDEIRLLTSRGLA